MKIIGSVVLATILAMGMSGCGGSSSDTGNVTSITATQKKAVLTTYADIALANYTQAHTDAIALQIAVLAFTNDANETTLQSAKDAWLEARESYGTTEAFRLSNGPIDGEETFSSSFGTPEGQLNAWPLNEAMIDYTQVESNVAVTGGNIIDGTGSFTSFTSTDGTTAVTLGDGTGDINITTINVALLEEFTSVDGDANVATGYHAVEFLLWG